MGDLFEKKHRTHIQTLSSSQVRRFAMRIKNDEQCSLNIMTTDLCGESLNQRVSSGN